jgi:hypothetical protein
MQMYDQIQMQLFGLGDSEMERQAELEEQRRFGREQRSLVAESLATRFQEPYPASQYGHYAA